MLIAAEARTPEMQSSDNVTEILWLIDRLRAESSLDPSPSVSRLFTNLVRRCLDPNPSLAAAVLADKRIQRVADELLTMCSVGEALLEKAWAAKILGSVHAARTLDTFPYRRNYRHLTRMEVQTLASVGCFVSNQTRICFLGGGPLPLTAYELYWATSAHVTVVDRDHHALVTASAVTERVIDVEQQPAITMVRANAETGDGLADAVGGCDVVILAALVGMNKAAKQRILTALGQVLRPNTYLLIRSAHGLRSLLYPVVDVENVLEAGFQLEAAFHPYSEVVNSILLARR
ncbi:MAG: nicotianamine synthase family protein [Actinomycetota bacterium]